MTALMSKTLICQVSACALMALVSSAARAQNMPVAEQTMDTNEQIMGTDDQVTNVQMMGAAEPMAAAPVTSVTPVTNEHANEQVMAAAEPQPNTPIMLGNAVNTDKDTKKDTASTGGDNMLVAAGQVGGQHSTYGTVGLISALPGSQLGEGWVGRVFAEEVTYRYKAGTGNIDATALGGAVSFGYQHTFNSGWVGGYGGVAYHHTHLSPDDASSAARGSTTALYLQGEGEENITKDFKMNLNAVVDVSGNTEYWTRLRALYRVTGDIYAGPEGVVQGDHDFKSYETGLAVVGLPITSQSSMGVDAGVRKTESVAAAGYAGLEFGLNF